MTPQNGTRLSLMAAALALAACSSSDASDRLGPPPNPSDAGPIPWKANETPEPPTSSTLLESATAEPRPGTGGGGGGTALFDGGITPPKVWCPSLPPDFKNVARTAPADATRLASGARAREELNLKRAPLPASIRGAEIENFYATPLAHPKQLAETLLVQLEMRKTVIEGAPIPGQYDLFVGIEGKVPATRPAVALTLLVDTTLTMGDEGMKRARAALTAIASKLQAQDTVRLLTTDPTDGNGKTSSAGTASTDLANWAQGLALGPEASVVDRIQTAYELAKSQPDTAAWNRVVVVTDGQGSTDQLPKTLLESSAIGTPPVLLVGIGVGRKFGESLLYRATEYGLGPYAYLDDANAADSTIGARFDRLFGYLASDLQLSIAAPWFAEVLDPGDLTPPDLRAGADSSRPQYLAPGAVLRFNFRIRLCDADIINDSLEVVKLLTLTVSAKPAGQLNVVSWPLALELKKLLAATDTTDMVRLDATRAFIAALRAPTAQRFDSAKGLLGPLSATWNPAGEMLGLLAQHPAN